jgi:hypothetical protein
MINGRWTTQWDTRGNNLIWTKWRGILGVSDTVSGIRLAAEGSRTRYDSPRMCFWVDDIYIGGRIVTFEEKPVKSKICKIYPNPFRSQTIVLYSLHEEDVADMSICDVAGRMVCRLKHANDRAVWDGRDANGRQVVPGVYFVKLVGLCGLSVGVTEKIIKL